jgi:hypothetical protein
MNAKDADVVLFVYDVTRKSTFVNISQWYQTVMENCKHRSEDHKLVFLIVGNMSMYYVCCCMLLYSNIVYFSADQPTGRAVTTKEGEDFARENGFMFFECSAKTDTDLDKKILLMIAKQLSENQTEKKNVSQLTNQQYQNQDEWIFNALLRNDVGQTIPVVVTYSRRRCNLVIRRAPEQKQSSKDKTKDSFMGIELSTTKQMHYCMHSKTILILESDDMEQRITWTCSIVSSPVPFQELIISLVFEAKVPMMEINEFGSVSDLLTTYTKLCVLMKEIPSSIIVNQFQMMSTNSTLRLDLSNHSYFQTNSKQKSRTLQIQSLFEPMKWTYGMIYVLNLTDAWLGDNGIEILCSCLKLQCIHQLRSLKLVNNEVSETGCNHLKNMFQSNSDLILEELDISNNPLMKDQGSKRVVEFVRGLSKLRYLGMANCGANNDAASLLIEVLNSNRKLKVNLSNNHISMTISDMILALPEDCLKMINFANNPIMQDTRISIATTENSTQTESVISSPTVKQSAASSKLIIDQTKLQIHRRIMNSVSIYTNPTFYGALKLVEQQTKVSVEMKVFPWAIDQAQRQDAMKAIQQDLTTLSKIDHPNCATYYGLYVTDNIVPPVNVNVLIENFGTPLSHWLYMTGYEFSHREKILIALEVAQGIQHLHSMNSMHLNLSSDTVMLKRDNDDTLSAKISYNGLSRWFQRGYIRDVRNAAYQSPELLKSKGKTGGTMKSDVYAFSILLWEIWYSKRPYGLEMLYYKDRKELLRQISDTGKRLHLPAVPGDVNNPKYKCERRVQSLIHSCWQHDPTLRPDFKYINIALKDTLESV